MSITSRRSTVTAAMRQDSGVGAYNRQNNLESMFQLMGVIDAPTPTAKTGDATLTIAELLTSIITATKASAVALTLPTGTLTDAGVTLDADQGFTWSVINLGSSSGAVTMTAGTDHTYVGEPVVAIATSARFLTRKTAANTYVTYRLA